MKLLKARLPISPEYDSAIFQALALQVVLGVLSLLIMDFDTIAQLCGIALVAFWGGAAVLVWTHRQSPSRADLGLIRFGYLPVILIAYLLVAWIWHLRGLT
jgi:hypothetical protein